MQIKSGVDKQIIDVEQEQKNHTFILQELSQTSWHL